MLDYRPGRRLKLEDPALMSPAGLKLEKRRTNDRMINIQPIIERIQSLLDDDSDQSVTYAALESRLALEMVCYDRLRQCHDYISHDQLRRWQPGPIMNILLADVDQHVTKTRTLKVSRAPVEDGEQTDDGDYVELGTEIGFDIKKIAKFWNALAKLALHVNLPKHQKDRVQNYGDRQKIRRKVSEVLAELKRLSKTTMTFSGYGSLVSFNCSCGEKNKRRADLLRNGQYVYCFNPSCKYTWKVEKKESNFEFESVLVAIDCDKCENVNNIPWRFFHEMKNDEVGSFPCHNCSEKIFVRWQLAKAQQPED